MTSRGQALAVAAFLTVALAGVLLRPVLPVDETRYLAVAWEMWLTGDFLVPTRNFELYADKPPLLFWLINLVWFVTGVSEAAARLVGPASAALAIWLTGRLAARLWPDDPGVAGRASLALAGTLVFALFGGVTTFDGLLALTTVAAMLALTRAVATERSLPWVAVGGAIALGVLAKGPVILIHTLPAMLAVPYWAGRPLRPSRVGVALATALALVSLWLVPAVLVGGPEYRDEILWTQSAGRVAGSFAHEQPWWFYLAMLPVLLFPWVWVPALVRAAAGSDWREPGLRLALVWGGSAFLLFTLISGKQTHYLVPDLPAAGLVVARLGRGLRFRPVLASLPLLALALAAMAAGTGLLPLGQIAPLLNPAGLLVPWGALLVATAWLAVRTGGLVGSGLLALGGLVLLNLLIGLTAARDQYDSTIIGAILARNAEHGLANYGQNYHGEFNFGGRLTVPVVTPETPEALAEWAAAHPRGVIVARPDRNAPPWEPRETVPFRNEPYAIWHVSDASVEESPS